ncbi:helix-turn-helix transcriptional regulator [Blastococcus sp. DSM 46786]|uniref:helix-turn-helix domain-containing protein n=1 Tax=Blastococcus sp. DSM 46786 TaxID=1798227 RepID=UPI000B80AC35
MSWTRAPEAQQWQVEFGTRLRELRKVRGWSQMELANAADLDPTYVSSVEQGRRNIALVNIRVLAQALAVDPADFFHSSTARREQASRGPAE